MQQDCERSPPATSLRCMIVRELQAPARVTEFHARAVRTAHEELTVPLPHVRTPNRSVAERAGYASQAAVGPARSARVGEPGLKSEDA